jgi:hypothetical protein
LALDGTFEGLKATIARTLNRDDVASDIPDWIVLAEAQMHRRFVGRQREGMPIPRRLIGRSTDSTIATGAEYISVPADFAGPIDFTLNTDPVTQLDYVDSTNLQGSQSANYRTGAPAWYSVVGGQFRLYPVADRDYTGELTYIKRLPALSAATEASNWVLQDYPDAYLFGALVQAVPFLQFKADDARPGAWSQSYVAAIDDICNADPMPTDKSALRTEVSLLTIGRRGTGYNLNTDR